MAGDTAQSSTSSYFTSLAVTGCALQYLATVHKCDTEVHEQALELQMAIALQHLPHIHENLIKLSEADTAMEVTRVHAGTVFVPRQYVILVFVEVFT